MMLSLLSKLQNAFDEMNVTWAVGGSLMLQLRGLSTIPNDIDLLVTEEDAPKLIQQLNSIGTPLEMPKKQTVLTSSTFAKYDFDGVGVDVMVNFGVKHEKGTYICLLDHDSISDNPMTSGHAYPLSALEDWYVLYLLMPNRESKVALIEKHFMKEGIRKPHLFERALRQPLPEHVELKIFEMLGLP
ncbi:nucleotidyltransferase domain-containing protein [Alkalicoccobacillus porphyridii]|uniref:Nucleotidyltransferase family protein n=1 Tax=Alkalicoccobacillus porphyridii TaxID=2597270 RepID=A0A553ZW80_9BACI|nr:hypothetical protein [Alkalicoccobacillus porphyridii]TSB45734.1 hypothetical protein FN960_14700 [Alkalicoccobacillus porphyridii]